MKELRGSCLDRDPEVGWVPYSVFQTGVCLFCVEIEVLIPTRPITSNLALIFFSEQLSLSLALVPRFDTSIPSQGAPSPNAALSCTPHPPRPPMMTIVRGPLVTLRTPCAPTTILPLRACPLSLSSPIVAGACPLSLSSPVFAGKATDKTFTHVRE
jgi:hypothetical protein